MGRPPGPRPLPHPRNKAAILAPLIPPGRDGGDALAIRGGKESFFNLARLHYDRPSLTVCKDIRNGQGGLLHPEHNRYIGLHELTRIGSIPDEYDWGTSKYRQVWNRVGNSVPPLFMRAVASTIRDQILAPARQQTATT
ncbi:DNA cytosine methyltransferase [Streptomyces sp. MNU103]|uniref:DNA cytosine methyltransferase n=1 Tax=Streptomyces sp. MNU103 TaxID=2560024 RepID=UPI001E2AD42D|nr:DNA cytosine methyltransferase [Streptomyces sp. MNU103]